MIRRYAYGKVMETEAILKKPQCQEGTIPYFIVDEEKMSFSFSSEFC